MPKPDVWEKLGHLRDEVRKERRQEIARAIGFRDSDPRRAAYHAGLADGKNGVANQIEAIMNSEGIMKGDKAYGIPR